jgi:putative ABC transport system ATP-binding protein
MPDPRDIVIELRGVQKNYHGLRPLRIKQLEIRAADSIALLGLDQAAAEVLVNLITAATLPDEGEVLALGRLTTTIADANTWLYSLEQFGIVSARSVLLDNMTVEQNLAIPLSLSLHDMPDAVRSAVRALADEVGLTTELDQSPAALSPLARLRLHLGRALAADPRVLLAEHPNALIPSDAVSTFAAEYSRIISARRIASLVLTADPAFATAIASRVLTLQPATGEIKPLSGWRRWFS